MRFERVDPEELVTDVTLDFLLTILDKHPKKKPIFKNFCDEYKILDIDELTEALALEVLEMIDSKSYILAIRAKEAKYLEEQKELLNSSVEEYLQKHKKTYLVISSVEDCWLVAKRVKLNVYTINENAVFQPFEKHEDREYFILIAIKTGEEFVGDEIINKFVSRGGKIIKISDVMDIDRKFEGIR
jgi:hypothetical protein